MLKRILFVDDEPMVLAALRTMLRRQRKVWEMVFVASGAEALAELGKAPFDAVVSDMRMPGIDGAELLARVQARWPETARFIPSGYSDPEALQRAQSVATACLSKPCDAEPLVAAIESAW